MLSQPVSNPETSSRPQFGRKSLLPLVLSLLVLSQVWFYFRISNVEKQLTATQKELFATQDALTATRTSLLDTIDTLSYVKLLAENADKYSHSHDTFSDARLKTNISEINNALDGVLSLRGVKFIWNTIEYPDLNLGNSPQIGFIAQELEVVYPELVTIDRDGFRRVDYARLVPVLVEAIKEQQFLIDDLQNQIIDLQNKDK